MDTIKQLTYVHTYVRTHTHTHTYIIAYMQEHYHQNNTNTITLDVTMGTLISTCFTCQVLLVLLQLLPSPSPEQLPAVTWLV